MSSSTAWLTKQLEGLESKLAACYARLPQHPDTAEPERIRAEIEIVKRCLAMCAETSGRAHEERVNVIEDVSMAEDRHQVIVSTVRDLISAKRITARARAVQLIGQMSDDSLQQFSQTIGCGAAEEVKRPDRDSVFKERYGEGWRLSRRSS
jgi:hypothetical protein